MDELRALLSENAAASLAIGGLAIGIFFGFVVQRTNFCTMGGISDMLTFGDTRRFRAWVFATAVAIVGAQALAAAGVVDLAKSMYMSATLDWSGALIGGLMFGFGMCFAGGCASRNLVRAGSGDLRSLFVVILMGMAAYAAIGGLLGPLRADLSNATALRLDASGMANQGLDAALAGIAKLAPATASRLVGAALALALIVYCFADAQFRASPVHIASGALVGLAVVAGWALTGLAADEMAATATAPVSLTFTRPAGDALEWIQRFTAQRVPNFGVACVFGVIFGAFLGAITSGRFRLATFQDSSDTLRNMFGAVLMGVGGVMALGCTIGQAVTGVSTLAIGSIIAFVAIVLGGVVGIRTIENMA
ncbi:MAG: YeeE/YedE family protein [Methylobacteriaceae bacterium]|nr:YeeE/YedE family protein [Methylobacteriaceae bacterium]